MSEGGLRLNPIREDSKPAYYECWDLWLTGLTQTEIAKRMGLTRNQVAGMLYRIRQWNE